MNHTHDTLYHPEPTPMERLLSPLLRFIHMQASGGIVLLVAAVAALVWANSPWRETYHALWATSLGFSVGGFGLTKPLILWINDGLMAVFFFTVGLEIKREVLVGELAQPRQALLPLAAAVGGMVAPSLVYLAFNAGSPNERAWGIPMGTDIAFALGVMTLLGSRVPTALKIFLAALAIADDLGSILVIALFYSEGLSLPALWSAAGLLALMLAGNALRVRWALFYWLLGVCLWFAFLKSGVHATVGGVLAALAIPASTRLDGPGFLALARDLLEGYHRNLAKGDPDPMTNPRLASHLEALRLSSLDVEPPLQRLERAHHPWVAFVIMPVFALANAGVSLEGGLIQALTGSLGLGVILGLVLGKQAGVFAASWLVVKTGLADLPPGVTWGRLYGTACLCGIGFTMSIFIATLALEPGESLAQAKMAVLTASLISGVLGWTMLRRR